MHRVVNITFIRRCFMSLHFRVSFVSSVKQYYVSTMVRHSLFCFSAFHAFTTVRTTGQHCPKIVKPSHCKWWSVYFELSQTQ